MSKRRKSERTNGLRSDQNQNLSTVARKRLGINRTWFFFNWKSATANAPIAPGRKLPSHFLQEDPVRLELYMWFLNLIRCRLRPKSGGPHSRWVLDRQFLPAIHQ